MTERDPNLRVECAWCDAVLQEGAPGSLVSHGICPECLAEQRRQLRELKERREVEENPRAEVGIQSLLREVNRGAQDPRPWQRLLHEAQRAGVQVVLVGWDKKPSAPLFEHPFGRSGPALVPKIAVRDVTPPGTHAGITSRMWLVHTGSRSGWGEHSLLGLARMIRDGKVSVQVESSTNPPSDDPWWQQHVESEEELHAAQTGMGRSSGRVRGWSAPLPLPTTQGQSESYRGAQWRTGSWWRIHPLTSNLRWDQVIGSDADPDPRRVRKTTAGARRWAQLAQADSSVWEPALAHALRQGPPMTFNGLVIKISQGRSDAAAQLGRTANVALWNLVAQGLVQHTDEAPIFFARRLQDDVGYSDLPLGKW